MGFDPSRAHSVLIEPNPSKLTERACEDHNLILFKGTVADFYRAIESEYQQIADPYDAYNPVQYISPNIAPQKQILFDSTFESVPKTPEASTKSPRFLLGAPITWDLLAANADIPRQAVSLLDRAVERTIKSDSLGTIYLSEPGSGKSAILKRAAVRAARKFQHVFFFTGFERISEDDATSIFDSISSDVVVFFDNAADFTSYFSGIFSCIAKTNIAFIGIERTYRFPYLEDAFSEFDVTMKKIDLDLDRSEARKLLEKNEAAGLSNIPKKREQERKSIIASMLSEPISVSNCRIQNNFLSFDTIIQGLIKETPDKELKLFVLASIARHSFSGGVSKAVLHAIPGRGDFAEIGNIYAHLPVVSAPGSPGYIIPARAAVSERVLEVLKASRPELLLETLVQISINLAPRVNRETISARTPESKLSGGIMDFDRTIERFIDPLAETFYEQIQDAWDWNSRYWEQLALLKLSRFLEDQSDELLLQEAIQNARYAYSIDEHPLSLTTLAKTLFTALESKHGDRDTIFGEGWSLIFNAIEIEKKWTRVKPTAFIVAFKGAIAFAEAGGQFSGEQAEEIRESVAITHQRKLSDRKLSELREKVIGLVSAG